MVYGNKDVRQITASDFAPGTLKVPASLCTYIITSTEAGQLTATPTDPSATSLETITTASVAGAAYDIGPVFNACVDAIAALGVPGMIGIEPPSTTNWSYISSQVLDCQQFVGIVSAGGAWYGAVYIDFSASSGLTFGIKDALVAKGISIIIKAGMDGIQAQYIDECSVQNGDQYQFKGLAATPFYMTGCRSQNNPAAVFLLNVSGSIVNGLRVEGNPTHIGEITLNTEQCYVDGIALVAGSGAGAILDSSTKVNHIIDPSQTGVLVAPAVAASVRNDFGTKVEVTITIGGTGTDVGKNATTIASGATNAFITVTLNPGETVTLSQTTAVSWVWFGL